MSTTDKTTFERETRYGVIKIKDAKQALTQEQLDQFEDLFGRVAEWRAEQGKRELECVVIESDWPEYEPAWKMIEERFKRENPILKVTFDAVLKSAAPEEIVEALCDNEQEWNGPLYGLPPVGMVCEIAEGDEYLTISYPAGAEVKIYTHFTDDRGVELAAFVDAKGKVGGVATAQCFRRIKTQREKCFGVFAEVSDRTIGVEDAFEALFSHPNLKLQYVEVTNDE